MNVQEKQGKTDPLAELVHFDLSGKSVVVTGAASGIGASVAEAMALAGGSVLLVDRDQQGLERTLGAVRDRRPDAQILVADLQDLESPQRVVDAAVAAFGSINVIASCAGIFEAYPIEDFPLDAYERILNVNLRAPFLLVQAARPYLSAGDSIILIASGTAVYPSPYGTAYAASKGGIVSLTRALAAELAPDGIRVNCVSPAFTDTAMVAAFLSDPEIRQQIAASSPNRRIGLPSDVAAAVLFLASPGAKHIHGTNLAVDGGVTVVAPTPPARHAEGLAG